MINTMFNHKILNILTNFFRYLNADQLNGIVSNLLKFTLTKQSKINLNKTK
jgi:hypothetical protein